MSLQIGVLSTGPSVYTTRRLKEAGAARGHVVCSFSVSGFTLSLGEGGTELRYRGKEVDLCDGLVARIGGATPPVAISIARAFESHGAIV